MKIPIKKYVMDESASWEDRYRQLEKHHEEETTWMIAEIKRLEASVSDRRVERAVLVELVTAAEDVLRAGEPPAYSSGPDEGVSDDAVHRLWEASAARKQRLGRALHAAREVTLSTEVAAEDEPKSWRELARVRLAAVSDTLEARPVGRTRTGRDVLSGLHRWVADHPDADVGLFRIELHRMLGRHDLSGHPSAVEVLARLLAATYDWDEVTLSPEAAPSEPSGAERYVPSILIANVRGEMGRVRRVLAEQGEPEDSHVWTTYHAVANALGDFQAVLGHRDKRGDVARPETAPEGEKN